MPTSLLRTKPKLKYCGITIVLSNPSRFDRLNLLSATGGLFFNIHCLQPEFNVMQCDIRIVEDKSPWLEGTRCIMLLGEAAMHHYCPDTINNTLNEIRGSPLYINNIPTIASYYPQDAADLRDYESQHNAQSKNYSGQERIEDDEDEGDLKSFSNTKRSNFAFWLQQDTQKCKRLFRQGTKEICRWDIEKEPIYKIYPSADEVIQVLSKTKDQFLDFDIETDYEEQNLLCFAFTFDNQTVYSVPAIDYEYKIAYSSIHYIIKALAKAIKNNTLVAHNGAAFDFFVLGYKYNIPVYSCFDTLLAQHRCFPEIEKSLGHCVSLWTDQRFHKDTDSRGYVTREQMISKLKYCAKDVFTMSLVRKAITKYARTIPGLSASIDCAMRSIRPYLISSLQGIRYSDEKVKNLSMENDRLMMQYLRIIDILVGPSSLVDVRRATKSNPKAFPSSNAQCCKYFHEMLEYPIVARSPITGKPSLNKKAMYKLALLFPENPVILFSMLYRKLQKEYSALQFIPWRDNNDKIVNPKEWIEKIL